LDSFDDLQNRKICWRCAIQYSAAKLQIGLLSKVYLFFFFVNPHFQALKNGGKNESAVEN
jgi:hypothetical protein